MCEIFEVQYCPSSNRVSFPFSSIRKRSGSTTCLLIRPHELRRISQIIESIECRHVINQLLVKNSELSMAIWPAHRPPTKRSYNSGSQIVEPLEVELFQGFEKVCVMADLYICHHIISLILRVVGGDEKGSLESGTVKYGHQSYGTRTRK
jgi:hypothetical protein